MSIDRASLELIEATLDRAASDTEIEEAEHALGVTIPTELRQLLKLSNGLLANDHIRIYSTAEIATRNSTYDIRRRRAGFLLIGDDSGGRGVFLPLSPIGGVFLSDLGSVVFDTDDREADDLADWISHGMKARWMLEE